MRGSAEQIKERLDIVETLNSYIKLEKSGINYKARCPFHNEKTASFFVSPTRQSFYCFGCQANGDIFTFVEKFEGLDFRGALELLAGKAGITLSKVENKEVERGRSRLFEVMEKATIFFEKNLEQKINAKEYIEKRGISNNSIKNWRIGFIEEEWRKLQNFLEGQGFTKEEMLNAGLIKKIEGEAKYYDTFRNRVMFPIFDSAGRVVAFSGRFLGEDALPAGEASKAPKYLNSPETELFRKSEVLYGFHLAKNSIRKLDYTVMVEGQIDLVLSHQSGVPNTVASSGTSITEEHLKKVQKLSNRVIIAYDSDKAGEKAALRASEIALAIGMEVKIAPLKDDEDPASIVQRDPEEWKETLRKAKHVIEFALEKVMRDKSGSALMKEIGREILPLLNRVKSEIEKSHLIKLIADKIGVKEESVWDDLRNIKSILENKGSEKKEEIKRDPESILLGLIFIKNNSKDKTEEGSTLLDKYIKVVGKERAEKTLSVHEKDKEILMFQSEQYINSGNLKELIQEILDRIELNYLKEVMKENTDKLDRSSEKEIGKLKENIQKISSRIKELSVYI